MGIYDELTQLDKQSPTKRGVAKTIDGDEKSSLRSTRNPTRKMASVDHLSEKSVRKNRKALLKGMLEIEYVLERIYTISEVAEYLQISKSKQYYLV